jgi:hypothetical protein
MSTDGFALLSHLACDDAVLRLKESFDEAEKICIENVRQSKSIKFTTIILGQERFLKVGASLILACTGNEMLERQLENQGINVRLFKNGIGDCSRLLEERLPESRAWLDTLLSIAAGVVLNLNFIQRSTFWADCSAWLAELGFRVQIKDNRELDAAGRSYVPCSSQKNPWQDLARGLLLRLVHKNPDMAVYYLRLGMIADEPVEKLLAFVKAKCVPVPCDHDDRLWILAKEVLVTDPHRGWSPLVTVHCRLAVDQEIVNDMEDFMSAIEENPSNPLAWQAGILNACAILHYGDRDSVITCAIQGWSDVMVNPDSPSFDRAIKLADRTHEAMGKNPAYWTVTLAFIYRISLVPGTFDILKDQLPWETISRVLNETLVDIDQDEDIANSSFECDGFPLAPEPLPEDYAVRGLIWEAHLKPAFFPDEWFERRRSESCLTFEAPRKIRVAWLGHQLVKNTECILYNYESRCFITSRRFRNRCS